MLGRKSLLLLHSCSDLHQPNLVSAMVPVRRSAVHWGQCLLLGRVSGTSSLGKGLQFLLSNMAFSLQCLSISSPLPLAETPLVPHPCSSWGPIFGYFFLSALLKWTNLLKLLFSFSYNRFLTFLLGQYLQTLKFSNLSLEDGRILLIPLVCSHSVLEK